VKFHAAADNAQRSPPRRCLELIEPGPRAVQLPRAIDNHDRIRCPRDPLKQGGALPA